MSKTNEFSSTDLISRAALFNALANVKTLEEAFAVIQRIPAVPTDKGFIPRESAIRTAINLYHKCDTGSLEDYRDMMIEALEVLPPPSQRVGSVDMRWTPCSERLPDDTGDSVYVTVLDESGDYPFRYVAQRWAIPGHPHEWVVDGEYRLDVVAWMPCPRPWKGEI